MQNGVQHFHVVRLGLDGVREECVGFVGDALLHGHLFDREDELRLGEVLLDDGAENKGNNKIKNKMQLIFIGK